MESLADYLARLALYQDVRALEKGLAADAENGADLGVASHHEMGALQRKLLDERNAVAYRAATHLQSQGVKGAQMLKVVNSVLADFSEKKFKELTDRNIARLSEKNRANPYEQRQAAAAARNQMKEVGFALTPHEFTRAIQQHQTKMAGGADAQSDVQEKWAPKKRGKGASGLTSDAERARHKELEGKLDSDAMSDDEVAEHAALDRKHQRSSLRDGDQAHLDRVNGGGAPPAAAAPPDAAPESADAAGPPSETEAENAPPAPAAAPAQDEEEPPQGGGNPDLEAAAEEAMMGGEEPEPPAKPKRTRKPKGAPPEGAVLAPDQPGDQPPPQEEAAAPDDQAAPMDSTPPAEPVDPNGPPKMAMMPEMEDEAADESAPTAAPVAARKPRRPRKEAPPEMDPNAQVAAEAGGPVTATGNVDGSGGDVHRKQGLAVRTERGPNGGFYQITQNGKRRRISQAEYQSRQGKNNKPRHSSYFDANPHEQPNGPFDGYSRWNESDTPFHSANVEGGRAGMHPMDAHREEYQEEQARQKEERRAAREADRALTAHAHGYDRPNTPKGHFQGKKNLTHDDLRAHIRALSEFKGIGGRVGHRLSWIVDPAYETIYRDGKKYTKRKNAGGGRAFDLDTKVNPDGSITVQPKLLYYTPTKKHLSPKQIAYLIATGQIHPGNNKHDPEKIEDYGQAITLSAEDLKSGNLKKLNERMSHLAEVAHNGRGPRVNRQMHNLFETYGATHHNWRYDQVFNTEGREGTSGYASGRAGGGSQEHGSGQEEAYAASLRARQLADTLGPQWREKLATALLFRKASGGDLAIREVDGERYLHDPLLLSMTKSTCSCGCDPDHCDCGSRCSCGCNSTKKAFDSVAAERLRAQLRAVSARGGQPNLPPPRGVTAAGGPPATHGRTRVHADPKTLRIAPPRTKEQYLRDVNGGDHHSRVSRDLYDGRSTRDLRPKVRALLEVGHAVGAFDTILGSHQWGYGWVNPMEIHGDDPGTYSDALLTLHTNALLGGGQQPPLVVIQHGPGHHLVGDAHRLRAYRALGLARVRCYIGTPRPGAPGHQTSDIAYRAR
jgi:hypothetical protein